MHARRLWIPLLLLAGIGAGARADAAQDPLAPLPAEQWTPAKAAHLLRRAAFGGTLEEVERLHALGPQGAVDALLDWDAKPDPGVPRLVISVTARPTRAELAALPDRDARQKLLRDHRRRDLAQFAVIREWWIEAMLRSAYPLRERMTLFWHALFTSGQRDVRNSYHMYIQNTLFRREAAGNFRRLLHAVSKDPAMLEYLDNNRNRKQHPNENFAREVMELFTLGVGHYTEKDIQEAARAFTGWTFAGNHFRYDLRQHDTGEKRFLGRAGNFDGDQVLDIILEQPAASRHLAARLFATFAHEHPSPAVVEGLARTLRESGWELRPVLKRLFLSRAFYSPKAMGTRIKGPVELLVGLSRSLDMDPRKTTGLSLLAAGLGQALMEPPNVKGWAGGRAWITTSSLLHRYNVCGALVGLPQDRLRTLRNQPGRMMRGMRYLQQARRVDANGEETYGVAMGMAGMDRPKRRRGRGDVATYDVVAQVQGRGLEQAPDIVDYFSRTLLANPPGPDLRAALLAYLERDGGFYLDAPDASQRLHGLLRLIVSTPEFQLS